MTDLSSSLPLSARSNDPFLFSIFALSRRLYCIVIGPPEFIFGHQNCLLSSSSSPAWSALCSHSAASSASPPRLPTSVVIKYLSSGLTACSFAKKLASHLFSGLLYIAILFPALEALS